MEDKIVVAMHEALDPAFEKHGMKIDDFSGSDSLIVAGIIDSMTFINILLDLESKLGISFDFNGADFAEIVSLNGLKNFILHSSPGK